MNFTKLAIEKLKEKGLYNQFLNDIKYEQYFKSLSNIEKEKKLNRKFKRELSKMKTVIKKFKQQHEKNKNSVKNKFCNKEIERINKENGLYYYTFHIQVAYSGAVLNLLIGRLL